MLPGQVSNPGPLTYESGALPIALRGPAQRNGTKEQKKHKCTSSIHGKGAEHSIFCNLPAHAGKIQISLGICAVSSEPSLAA